MKVSRLLFVALGVMAGLVTCFWRNIDAGDERPAASAMQVHEQEMRNAVVAAATPELPGVAEMVEPQASDARVTIDPPSSPERDQPAPDNPTVERTVLRSMTESSNPDIGEALGLTPVETEALLELIVTHRQNMIDQTRSMLRQAREHPEELAAATSERMRAEEVELQAFLGDRYPRWKDYDSLLRPAWRLRRDFRAALEAAGLPMTDAQSTALTSALEAAFRAFGEAGRSAAEVLMPGTGMLQQLTSERRQKLVDAAAPQLTPLQLETFREVVRSGGGRGTFQVN